MKVILFGATGMVGQGVLRECLADPEVIAILAIVRQPTMFQHPKFREIIHQDFTNFAPLEKDLAGWDVCFFTLGKSSAGMTEEAYRRVTYDIALAAGKTLARLDPGMTFVFISGAGTDSTEKGPIMWARVKGATENALLKLSFKAAYMFRPAYIQPLDGITSREKLYRVFYVLLGFLYPLWKLLFPKYVTTTRQLGRAMIKAAKLGASKKVLENRDFNEL